MTYKIVSALTAKELEISINTLINLDWIPQGGVHVTAEGFFQAMVKVK